jgi:hypothetical protein
LANGAEAANFQTLDCVKVKLSKPATRWLPQMLLFASRIVVSAPAFSDYTNVLWMNAPVERKLQAYKPSQNDYLQRNIVSGKPPRAFERARIYPD